MTVTELTDLKTTINWLLENGEFKDAENSYNIAMNSVNILEKQLSIHVLDTRYDANKFIPPFRVGRKQGKAVLDGKGLEVVFFKNSEEQAKMYCDYLNNVC